jgi:hypothetical protein
MIVTKRYFWELLFNKARAVVLGITVDNHPYASHGSLTSKRFQTTEKLMGAVVVHYNHIHDASLHR